MRKVNSLDYSTGMHMKRNAVYNCTTENKALVLKDMDLFNTYPKVVLEKILKATRQISREHNTENHCVQEDGWDNLISFNYIPAQRKSFCTCRLQEEQRQRVEAYFCNPTAIHPSFGSRLAWTLHIAQLCLHPLWGEESQDNYAANSSKKGKIAETVFSFPPELSW